MAELIEFNKKRKLVIRGFAVIYAVFAVMLLYLFFLSPSIELKESISNSGKQVFLVNSTEREIHNTQIYYSLNGEKKIIESFESIKPGEQKEIDLTPFNGMHSVELFAEAPFHNAFRLEVLLESGQVNLAYNVKVQKTILINQEFELILEICNSGKNAEGIKIMESHEEDYFKETAGTKTVSVESGKCSEVNYFFTPLKSGKTVMLFNIEFESNMGSITKELFIQEPTIIEEINEVNENG
ncbi:MAG: hypothetical protein JW703_04780 [Candidatus Diapherotrites archaeon]|nr:hypothetical protein [Candidatus Diapherotrites archaeon]